MRKLFAPPAIHYKGSGWAKKDRGGSRAPKAASSTSGSAGDAGSSTGSSTGDSASASTGSSGSGD